MRNASYHRRILTSVVQCQALNIRSLIFILFVTFFPQSNHFFRACHPISEFSDYLQIALDSVMRTLITIINFSHIFVSVKTFKSFWEHIPVNYLTICVQVSKFDAFFLFHWNLELVLTSFIVYGSKVCHVWLLLLPCRLFRRFLTCHQ